LMQAELSNLVLLPVLLVLIIDFRQQISLKMLFSGILAFIVTWISKIIYDVGRGFTQTLGFIAWVAHRLLPFGPFSGNEEILPLVSRVEAVKSYFGHLIFWISPWTSFIFFLLSFFIVIRRFRLKDRLSDPARYLLLLWFIFPFLGLLVQGSPAGGYVPVFFGLTALIIGRVVRICPLRLVCPFALVCLVIFNINLLLKNDFYLLTGRKTAGKNAFNMNQAYFLSQEVAGYIVKNSGSLPYNLVALGSYAEFPSQRLDLVYLTWYLGHAPSEKKEKLVYFVYGNDDEISLGHAADTRVFEYLTVARQND